MYLLNHKKWEGTPCYNDELFKWLKKVFRKLVERVSRNLYKNILSNIIEIYFLNFIFY